MFFLGILSIFQVLVFPGLIFTKLINFRSRFIARLVAVAMFSLVFNYCLVFLLTAAHIYTRPVLLGFVICEIIFILWQNWEALRKPLDECLSDIQEKFKSFISQVQSWLRPATDQSPFHFALNIIYIGLCMLLAYVALKWIVKLFLWNMGSVFDSYDTIKLWNQWALDWANNTLPAYTWRYPQLIPTNWSMIFTIIGNPSIQFFAQAIMPLFTLLILLMIVDLGFYKKNPGFFLGATIAYLTLKKFLGPFLIAGLSDLPCAFLTFTAIYLLFLFQSDSRDISEKKWYGYLIAISAAGGSVTKQVGLVFLVLFSILFFRFFFLPVIKEDKKLGKRTLLICIALMAVIVIPWYLYKQVLIWQGIEKSEVGMIVDATKHAFNYEDVLTQIQSIIKQLGKYFYLLLFLIPLTFFVDPMVRYINLFLVFPLFISWSLFASYDYRNLSLALPLFSISSGLSIQYLVDLVFNLIKKIPIGKIKIRTWVIVIAIVLVVTSIFVFPSQSLEDIQTQKAINDFSPSINQILLSIAEEDKGNFLVITNYPMENLPGLRDKSIGNLFTDYEGYRFTLENINSENTYILIPKHSNQLIMEEIDEKISNGEYTLLLEDDSWIPYLLIKVMTND